MVVTDEDIGPHSLDSMSTDLSSRLDSFADIGC